MVYPVLYVQPCSLFILSARIMPLLHRHSCCSTISPFISYQSFHFLFSRSQQCLWGIALQPLYPIWYTTLLLYNICSHTCVGLAVHLPAGHTTLPPLSLSYQLNNSPLQQTPGAQPRVSPKCQLLELSSSALHAVPTMSLSLHGTETVLTACSPRGLLLPLASDHCSLVPDHCSHSYQTEVKR